MIGTASMEQEMSSKRGEDEAPRRSHTHAASPALRDCDAKKAKVLRILKGIAFPPMPPLDEILHELGHDAVAEMTGRRGEGEGEWEWGEGGRVRRRGRGGGEKKG